MKYETDSRSERVGCESGKVSDGTIGSTELSVVWWNRRGLRFFRAVGHLVFCTHADHHAFEKRLTAN